MTRNRRNCGCERTPSHVAETNGRPKCGAGEQTFVPVSEGRTADGTPRFTVLIAEDDAGMRDSYRYWFAGIDRWEMIGAAEGEETLSKLDESVDVLILDRAMPDVSGSEVLARLDETEFRGKVVVSAYEPDDELAKDAVSGYLTKPI